MRQTSMHQVTAAAGATADVVIVGGGLAGPPILKRAGGVRKHTGFISPEQRAVFLLREIFDSDYAEIAAIVGKSEAN
jgi:hypothetical protein